MNSISLEFYIKLKRVCHPSRARTDEKFAKVPNIRKYLLLAYQIDDMINTKHDTSLTKIASWLGMTYPRMKQITDLLYLCPKIQEALLLGDTDKINRITEYALRPVVKEVNWQEQLSLWQNLSK